MSEQVADIDKRALALALYYWRTRMRMTQKDVAHKLGVGRYSIQHFETTGTSLSEETLVKLPTVFGFRLGNFRAMVDEIPADDLPRLFEQKVSSFREREKLRSRMTSREAQQKS